MNKITHKLKLDKNDQIQETKRCSVQDMNSHFGMLAIKRHL